MEFLLQNLNLDPTLVHLTTIVLAMPVGVTLMVVSQYLRIPAIAPLMIGGILLGPEVSGIINPLVLGEALRVVISLGVATILFEGGLTLNREGFKRAPRVIYRLLTIGVLVTWIGTAWFIWLLFEYSFTFSMLAASLIIVTGPTVITPLLRRIGLKEKLHHILHYEGVIIDPLGAFVAILCFEWVIAGGELVHHLAAFGFRIVVGVGLGLLGGWVLTKMMQKEWVPEHNTNIFVLSVALFLYVISDIIVSEAGLLTVVVSGFYLGWAQPPMLKTVIKFKSELTDLAIAVLFILLAATLKFENFAALGWEGVLIVCIVLVLIRPVSIMLCSIGTGLEWNEIAFLSWMAPRGIVAGSIASLFSLQLTNQGMEEAWFLETFTFSIIAATVVIQGLSAGTVAQWLDVKAKQRSGWLIIGAHYFSRKVASFIMQSTKSIVVFLDTNAEAVEEAQREGFVALQANALGDNAPPEELRATIGNVMAMTDNRDLNQLICEKWASQVGGNHTFRWSDRHSETSSKIKNSGHQIWTQLPKPSQVAYELKHREAMLIPTDLKRVSSKLNPATIPLLHHQGDELKIASKDFSTSLEGSVLLFQQKARLLPFYLHVEDVLRLDYERIPELFAHLIKHVEPQIKDLDMGDLLRNLLNRERSFPTALSSGVSIPHAHLPGLKEPILVFAQLPHGIRMVENQKELYRLVILLLSPDNDPETHLILLAEIAKIASTSDMVDRLVEITDPGEVVQLLMHLDD